MKTAEMIEILREGGEQSPSFYEEVAQRLEQIRDNLRITQTKLVNEKMESRRWRIRFAKTQEALKNIVHENELLDNLIN